jgi:hypothetical protein
MPSHVFRQYGKGEQQGDGSQVFLPYHVLGRTLGMEPTAYSVRSAPASGSGSYPAFGFHIIKSTHWCGFRCAYTVEWVRQWPFAQYNEVQSANWQAGGDYP